MLTSGLALYFGIVGAAILALTLVVRKTPGLPRGFTKPMLALEMARTNEEVKRTRDRVRNASSITTGIIFDSIVVIPAYTVLFILFARSETVRPLPYSGLLQIVIAAAAAADFAENISILRKRPAFPFGAAKWALIALELALVAVVFFQKGGYWPIGGVVYLLSAIGLTVGVWYVPILEYGFSAMGLALLITGFSKLVQ
jgi:hypothetical protein